MKKCNLVQLRHQCKMESMYGMNYGYRSGLNRSMVTHLTDITTKIKYRIHIHSGDIILDIGSNDATTLKSYDIDGVKYIGMDPSAKKFRKYYPEEFIVVEDFFLAEKFKNIFSNSKAKVVTSIAMFYDLENPISFVRDIFEILDDEGIWIFEQSYLPFMIESMLFDTICQEHLEYYTLKQIKYILDTVGFKIIDIEFNNINGGSFKVTAAKKASNHEVFHGIDTVLESEIEKGYNKTDIYKKFLNDIEAVKKNTVEFLKDAKNSGKRVYGYGASTKGNVLLQYFGITKELLPFIAEVNEDKYGHVTPGTKIPIISEEEAKRNKPDYFFVLPWHFKDNIIRNNKGYIKDTGCKFVFPLPEFEII